MVVALLILLELVPLLLVLLHLLLVLLILLLLVLVQRVHMLVCRHGSTNHHRCRARIECCHLSHGGLLRGNGYNRSRSSTDES